MAFFDGMPSSIYGWKEKIFFVKRTREKDFSAEWNLSISDPHNDNPTLGDVDLDTYNSWSEGELIPLVPLLAKEALVTTGLSPATLEGRLSGTPTCF